MKNEKPYSLGAYNKRNKIEQWVRLTEGCPNACEYCRESNEAGKKPVYFAIPKITRRKVKIMDMNLLYKANALNIIKHLGAQRVNGRVVTYELICGVDHRFLTQEHADALHAARFVNIRFAWDSKVTDQYIIKDCINRLVKAGYQARRLTCFILSDWKISYSDCCIKLDLLKVWNVKAADCYYNNATPPAYQLNYWSWSECMSFRAKCRKHNIMVLFRADPELMLK